MSGSKKPKEQRPAGDSFGRRLGKRARALGVLGDDIVNRPGVLPGKAHGWFRQWFAKVWRVRGGGLYACGFAVSFVFYEIRMLVEDFTDGSDFVGLFNGEIFGFMIDFFVDSIMNTVQALIWPAHVATLAPPYGAIALGVAFVLFPMTVKPIIERWLFGGEVEADKETPH